MPKGVYVRTKKIIVSEETKLKNSHRMKLAWANGKMKGGWKHTDEWKKEQSERLKNRIPNPETFNKISIALTGRKLTDEIKYKISQSKIGKPLSFEHKEKLRIISIKNGSKPPTLKGKDSPCWIKDRTKLKKDNRHNNSAYKEWRMSVYSRDNFKCKINNYDCKGRLEAHHILTWRDYPELRYEINNGITLCHAHHPLKRAEEKRLSSYFQELINQEV